MSRPAPAIPRISVEEYLEMEISSSIKHEYVAGYVYAMSGTTDTHNLISINLVSILRNHLRGTPCRAFIADLKARIESADVFYYPDVMVSCEESTNAYYREQPILIIEVLSSSTASFDAGDKRLVYQSLESLKEYVLVSQECMDVRVWRRAESGDWTREIYTDGTIVSLTSVNLQIPIEQIYEEVW